MPTDPPTYDNDIVNIRSRFRDQNLLPDPEQSRSATSTVHLAMASESPVRTNATMRQQTLHELRFPFPMAKAIKHVTKYRQPNREHPTAHQDESPSLSSVPPNTLRDTPPLPGDDPKRPHTDKPASASDTASRNKSFVARMSTGGRMPYPQPCGEQSARPSGRAASSVALLYRPSIASMPDTSQADRPATQNSRD
ncbi:hypothetical protein CF319_g5815 [Tilletia indica]|nr:hypothetical protein CF319_g5815 [Tilletia indica]